MKKLVFLGNCQARRLEILYNEQFSQITGDTTEFIASYEPMTERVRQIMTTADVLVAQAIDSEHEITIKKVDTKAQIIEFPNVTGMFLWPHSGQPHVCNTPLPNMPDGPYGMQFGNRWLDAKIKAGADPDDIIDEYESLDVGKAINLSRMYDLVMDRARQRDERTGFGIASIIEKSLAEVPLFLTPANLELPLFRPLAQGVYERLGIPSGAASAMLDTLWRTPFPIADNPIHPSIARHFGLKYIGPDARYRTFTGEQLSFREWINRYVRYQWNDTLLTSAYKGSRLRRFDAEAQAALDDIAASMAVSSGSAYGESCRAHLLKLKGDHAGAIAATQRAAALDPTNPQIIGTLVLYLAEQGDFDEAERLANHLTTTWPRYGDGWNRLGVVLLRAGKLLEGVTAIERAIEIEPRNVEFRKHLASTLSHAGQRDSAGQVLAAAIAMMPQRAELHFELSRLLVQAGDLDAALISAREAVTLDDENASLHGHVANVLTLRNDLIGAANALRKATRIAPEDVGLSNALTNLLRRISRRNAADTDGGQALPAEPVTIHMRHVLAQNLIKQGALPDAERVLVEALSIDPSHDGLHAGLIGLLARMGRVDDAETAARRAVENNPANGHLHHILADTLQSCGKLREAEQTYRAAISLASDQIDWRGTLALVVNRQGRLDESLLIIDEAVAMSPENPHLLAKQSFLLAEKKDFARARAVIEVAIAIAPQLAGLHGTLADLCEREGNLRAATSAYDLAIRLDSQNPHYQRQAERIAKLNLSLAQTQAAE